MSFTGNFEITVVLTDMILSAKFGSGIFKDFRLKRGTILAFSKEHAYRPYTCVYDYPAARDDISTYLHIWYLQHSSRV